MLRKTVEDEWRTILAALYLSGSPHGCRLDVRRWPSVLGALRSQCLGAREATDGFRNKGLFAEAAALQCPSALEWAAAQVREGKTLTCLDDGYPLRWHSALKEQAPPVAWQYAPTRPGHLWLGVVGSRDIPAEVHRFCAEAARAAVVMGYGIVSGGAAGCDRAAQTASIEAGGQSLSLLPFGLRWHDPARDPGIAVTLCEEGEPFSRGRAMERNELIYAAAGTVIVGAVRFREGGTWHGSTAALRRRRTSLLVRRPDADEDPSFIRGARALVSLGAKYLTEPHDLDRAMAEGQTLNLFSGLRAG